MRDDAFNIICEVLLGAWFLTWFSIEEHLLQGCKELFNIELTIASYYTVAFIIAVIIIFSPIIKRFFGSIKNSFDNMTYNFKRDKH